MRWRGQKTGIPSRQGPLEELKQLRTGHFEDDGRTPVTVETRVAVRTAAEALVHAGVEVQPVRPEGSNKPASGGSCFELGGTMLLDSMTKGKEDELSPIPKQFGRLPSVPLRLTRFWRLG